jgi:uridine phosphorylase
VTGLSAAVYPILEFDPAPEALIEPSRLVTPTNAPAHCVICFFSEVLKKLEQRPDAKILFQDHWEDGVHTIYEIDVDGRRLAVVPPGVGGPMAAGMLEAAIALGCRAFVVCGGAGVLNREIAVGHLVVPTSAVRDEGTSYHYLAPSREAAASPEAIAVIETVLRARGVPYITGKTWTTDATYRETREKVKMRRDEGCVTVEMEAASLFAVARFRNVTLGQILYGGDDVSGEEWDSRGWSTRMDVRERLFWLAAEACLAL